MALLKNYRGTPHHSHTPFAASPRRERSDDASAAIQILRERFARGEVGEEEFTRRLNLLKDS
jgi:uncharacterized membrane protein